jgi:DNA gyrase subunit A
MGVRGIKLVEKDMVVTLDVLRDAVKKNLLVLTEKGLGKKTPVSAFRNQNRGGQGIKVANISDKTGPIVYARVVPSESEELIITSQKGQVVKINITSIPLLSRNAQGVILMRFSKSADRIASATCIEKEQ